MADGDNGICVASRAQPSLCQAVEMPNDMSDEVLFKVVGDQAKLATAVKIEDHE
jgi:hypothetical protein